MDFGALTFTSASLPSTAAPESRIEVVREHADGAIYDAFEAGKRGGFRGWFYLPNLEPNRQMSPMTRRVIQEKSMWIYNNIGLGKSMVNRRARYEAGTGIWPVPRTSKSDWNKKTKNYFHDRTCAAEFFDVAGEENFYTAQVSIRRHVTLTGDHFAMPMLSESNVPQVRFIPGYAIDNAWTPGIDQTLWQDGFMTNEFGRVLKYRVLGNDRSIYTDVSANDIWRFRDAVWTGQRRPPPMFHHAAEHLFDINDILHFEKAGVRLSSQIGYVLTLNPEAWAGPRLPLPGATPVTPPTEQVDNGRNGALTVQRIFGNGTIVPELPPGAKIDMLKSDRPSTSFTGFLDYLVRDAAWGADYSPEFYWFLGGVGGAPLRYVIDDAQMTIESVQQNMLIPQWCKKFYQFFVWQEMKAGRLDYPGDDWWKVDWLIPRNITVDKGREGRLDDDRLATGKMSGKDYFGRQGKDAEDVEDDIIEEVRRKMEKCKALGIPYELVFRPPPGTAAAPIDEPEEKEDAPPTAPKK